MVIIHFRYNMHNDHLHWFFDVVRFRVSKSEELWCYLTNPQCWWYERIYITTPPWVGCDARLFYKYSWFNLKVYLFLNPRLYLHCRTNFIARCLRHSIMGMLTGPIICSCERVPHYKMNLCYIPACWGVWWIPAPSCKTSK